MMMQRSWEWVLERESRRWAYSRAELGSWMEQGPTMTRRRSSVWVMQRMASRRPRKTVSWVSGDWEDCQYLGRRGEGNWGNVYGWKFALEESRWDERVLAKDFKKAVSHWLCLFGCRRQMVPLMSSLSSISMSLSAIGMVMAK